MNKNEIRGFSGEYRFLSNFWPCRLDFGRSWIFPSSEHAYQAAKSNDLRDWGFILAQPTPGQAKRAGAKITLRPDWDQVKLDVMHEILTVKFSIPSLKERLLRTGTVRLVEENTWGDRYWGICNGIGENHLGKLLMRVRDEIHHTLQQ